MTQDNVPKNLIYALWDPRFEDVLRGVRYIGQSSSGMKRPKSHMDASSIDNDVNIHKSNWIRMLFRLGLEPRIVVLKELCSPDELDLAEIELISEHKKIGCDLLNRTDGGGGLRGFEHSEETRKKISDSKSGVPQARTVELIQAQAVLPPVWTPIKAWWLGMLYGRGFLKNNNNDDRHEYLVSFTSTDLELVEQWGAVIGVGNDRIRKKGSSSVMDVYDIRLVKWLSDQYKLDSKFDGELSPPSDLPSELFVPFLRGIWDSRGSISCKKKNNGKLISVIIRFNSEPMVDWIVARSPGLIKGEARKNGKIDAFMATRVGSNAVSFLKFLYSGFDGIGSSKNKDSVFSIINEYESVASTKCSRCGEIASFGKDLCHSCSVTKWSGALCSCGEPVVASGMCVRCYGKHNRTNRSWISAGHVIKQLESYSIDWASLTDDRREEEVEKIVRLYAGRGFPGQVLDLSEEDPIRRVSNGSVDASESGVIKGVSSVGQRTCLKFHMHRFEAKHHQSRTSVKDAFDDERHLRSAIKLQLRYGDPVTPKGVCRAMSAILHGPTNFPPSLARWLCDEFAKPGGTVLDPCSGFGGRALGSLSSSKNMKYIGFDVEPRSVAGNIAMAAQLGCSDRIDMHQSGVEDVDKYPDADFAMTSPPYYETEHYGEFANEKLSKYHSLKHWIDGFLKDLIVKTMRAAPVFVLNIGASGATDLSVESERIASENGFIVDRKWIWRTASFGAQSKERLLLIRRPSAS